MTQAVARRTYTPDDLLTMDDGDAYELDDGELVEVPVGAESQEVALELVARLVMFLKTTTLGKALPFEVGLQIFPARPRRIPRSDGGYISYERLAGKRLPKGFLTVAPELLIESVSPGDRVAYLDRKIQEYLSAGVRLVWILLPDTRAAAVYRADGSVTYVHPNGALDGEDVLPGFRCPLVEIMPPDDEREAGPEAD